MMNKPLSYRHSGRLLRVAMSACALIALAACSSGTEVGKTDKGKERVSILEQSHKVEADTELKGSKLQLPGVTVIKAWPEAGYDPSHVMPNAAINVRPKEVWSSDVGEGSGSDFKMLAKPVVADGLVFTMDAQGLVKAFDANNGDERWRFDTTPADHDENAMGGGIGFDNGVLFATTGFGDVLALAEKDGRVIWRRALLNPIRGAPTIADGRVYVVNIENELQALSAKTGEVQWHHRGIVESATLMGASNPAVSGDGLIVAYSSGEIFNLRPETGRAAWGYTLTVPTQVGALPAIADIRGLPVIDQGRVYAVSHNGRIAAIDQRTGDRAWEADIGGVNTPLVAGDAVFVLSNELQLVAVSRDTGRVRWVHDVQKFEDPDDKESARVFWAGPILAANRLWMVNSLGQLVSFSPDDGKQIDVIDLDDPLYIAPIVANNTMYVIKDNGHIVALK